GRTAVVERDHRMRTDMLQRFVRLLRGLPDADISVATLDVAREHTRFISAASEAAPIHEVPSAALENISTEEHGSVQAVRGIESIFQQCAQRRQMLHESVLLPFTHPPAVVDMTRYAHFAGPYAYATRAASTSP